jgi:hypothetical protein
MVSLRLGYLGLQYGRCVGSLVGQSSLGNRTGTVFPLKPVQGVNEAFGRLIDIVPKLRLKTAPSSLLGVGAFSS